MNFIDDTNLTPNDKFYTSSKVKLNHLEEGEQVEIKASEPLQVRINGGPWIDIRSINEV